MGTITATVQMDCATHSSPHIHGNLVSLLTETVPSWKKQGKISAKTKRDTMPTYTQAPIWDVSAQQPCIQDESLLFLTQSHYKCWLFSTLSQTRIKIALHFQKLLIAMK